MAQSKKHKTEITEEMLKKLQEELRELDLSWVETLCDQIHDDKKVEQRFKDKLSERKIYNVFNGVVRNGAWKVLIYSQADVLKEKLTKKLSAAIK